MAVKIFVTGGTFDKEYNEIKEEMYFKETHVPEMLKLGRNRVDIDLRTLMLIDSTQMTDEDRDVIVANIKKAKEDRILVTHGTSTMVETAKYIAARVQNKTVVMTGAMIPYRVRSSDGIFNLGSALGFVQTLPPGTYVAMNGKCFNWDNVVKNVKLGEFEEIK